MKNGDKVGVSAQALATALKGSVWGIPEDGVMWDGAFTGELTADGDVELLVIAKARSQRDMEKKT